MSGSPLKVQLPALLSILPLALTQSDTQQVRRALDKDLVFVTSPGRGSRALTRVPRYKRPLSTAEAPILEKPFVHSCDELVDHCDMYSAESITFQPFRYTRHVYWPVFRLSPQHTTGLVRALLHCSFLNHEKG